eukprot:TRINITY_DN10177_c0_g1_i1.p1 TRINITY_DN10177_c0_g1~~TRINITY_DN10177_c0_g1_i1.p1  ORF type:complete len:353 (+),score=153.72 TRINITY_DN10177_c0_g1_i1:51-1061(+)
MANKQEKFEQFTQLVYFEQAKAFMNAYWGDLDNERIWEQAHLFVELDIDNGKEGSDLDEFNAHRFLEKQGETKSVRELRDELKEIDMDFNKRMALVEYLLFAHQKSVSDFIARPQGENTEEVAAAQAALEEAQAALASAQEAHEKATADAASAKADANASKAAAEEAADDAAKAEAAENDLQKALAELHAQEEDYNNQCEMLRKKSEEGGVVSRGRAKNELEQLLSQDPLPLNRAKLDTAAATKKAAKATAAAKESQQAAEQAAEQAAAAAAQAEESAAHAEAQVQVAAAKIQEAEDFLEEVKSRPGGGQGAIWWIERELAEARKYMPRGGVKWNP